MTTENVGRRMTSPQARTNKSRIRGERYAVNRRCTAASIA